MKRLFCLLLCAAVLAGCTAAPAGSTAPGASGSDPVENGVWDVKITLSDESIGVDYSTDGASGTVNSQEDTGVYTANDIVYYEAGHDFTYGEGEEADGHTAGEAAKHTVVHITKPGIYRITGSLSLGQIAVDLGEEAQTDPNAVVTLILDNVNITCTVAPAIIFYNVYECGDKDNPSSAVDTTAAGANVILENGSVNNIVGSHVAEIYKPDSVVLDDNGEVEDAQRLHKYDAAFYSRMSMNIGGEGCLNITADNEGLDSELHLTINSGVISIASGNDGINTNEDGVSVTTINGGLLTISVTGSTGEGDGIDSNGWLVINGGTVISSACATSGDAGIDSDMGIHINGGIVMATGNMLDRIEDGGQTHAVFTFATRQEPGIYTLKNADGQTVLEMASANAFQYLIFSAPTLTEGTYTLWSGDTQFEGIAASGGMGGGMIMPIEPIEPVEPIQPIERPDWPNDPPDVEIPPQPTNPLVTYGVGESPADPGQIPTDDLSEQSGQMALLELPEGSTMPTMPEGMTPPEWPEGERPESPEGEFPEGGFGRRPIDGGQMFSGTPSADFVIKSGANYFVGVTPVTKGGV